MQYHGHDTSAYLTANYIPNENLRFFANVTFNATDEGMDGIFLNPASLNYSTIPTSMDYTLDDLLGNYSHLTVRQIMAKYGLEYSWNSGWYLQTYVYNYDYKDKSPYLFDSTGRLFSVVGGIGYKF